MAIRIQFIFRIAGVHAESAEHSDPADSSGLIPGTRAAHSSFQLEPPCALHSTCTLRSAEQKLHAGIPCIRQQLLKNIYSDSSQTI